MNANLQLTEARCYVQNTTEDVTNSAMYNAQLYTCQVKEKMNSYLGEGIQALGWYVGRKRLFIRE